MVIICAVLLIIVVLVQKGKGGGLASGLGQGNQVFGVKRTTDFIEKTTWGLSIALVLFCLLASFAVPKKTILETPPPQQQQQQQQQQNNAATAPNQNQQTE
jgi:preprotein translocase subunit SecG